MADSMIVTIPAALAAQFKAEVASDRVDATHLLLEGVRWAREGLGMVDRVAREDLPRVQAAQTLSDQVGAHASGNLEVNGRRERLDYAVRGCLLDAIERVGVVAESDDLSGLRDAVAELNAWASLAEKVA